MGRPIQFPGLEEKKFEIESRLAEFSRVPKSRWLRECIVCLLTPQSSPVRAEAALLELEKRNLYDQHLSLEEISNILRNPKSYVRFHNVKAKRVLKLLHQWPNLKKSLISSTKPQEQRRILVSHVDGFGYKEASHALRNIGGRNLAILDRHILRELVEYQVIDAYPKTMTPKRYEEIEERFRSFADEAGYDLDVLDLYFWSKRTGFIFK